MNEKILADRRVLLAEDSVDIQRLVSLLLSRAGADIAIVDNGRDAVDAAMSALTARPFDVVLMDIQMPRLDGLMATRQLRGQGYEGTVVAMTAMGETADRRTCLAAGCDDHISLPASPHRIVEVISRFCVRPAAAGQSAR